MSNDKPRANRHYHLTTHSALDYASTTWPEVTFTKVRLERQIDFFDRVKMKSQWVAKVIGSYTRDDGSIDEVEAWVWQSTGYGAPCNELYGEW